VWIAVRQRPGIGVALTFAAARNEELAELLIQGGAVLEFRKREGNGEKRHDIGHGAQPGGLSLTLHSAATRLTVSVKGAHLGGEGTTIGIRHPVDPDGIQLNAHQNSMKAMSRTIQAAGGLLLFAAGVTATELDALLQNCASLRNDYERLACYDSVVAQSAGDAAKNVASAEAMFGMSREVSGKPSTQAPEREELPSISAQVRALQKAPSGSLLIELDNGQTWRQVDSRNLQIKVGDSVTISRGALNSFRIATPHNRFGRVTRVQ
jgi:hypothetical protein